jgi:2-polyprenyl-3-methyl-5-hydroxy-6-metoxy-1,4-benzoquinol methylase
MLDAIYRRRAQGASDFINDARVRTVIDHVGRMETGEPVRILEVGCGSGSFLSKLRRGVEAAGGARSVEYTGIDIDGHAVARNQDPRIALLHRSAEELASTNAESYDIALHFELIEHLVDPSRFMTDVRRLLKAGGVMIFTTPNAAGLEMLASSYNARRLLAHSIFPPMHLNAFSTANIVHFALRHDFAVVSVRTPGVLDVDMVSLSKNDIADAGLRALADLDDETKGLIQYVIARCNASSHLQCVLRKM